MYTSGAHIFHMRFGDLMKDAASLPVHYRDGGKKDFSIRYEKSCGFDEKGACERERVRGGRE